MSTSAEPQRLSGRVTAGVELGGTKTIAVIGCGADILARVQFPTTTPSETLGRVAAQLRIWHNSHKLEALGVASFGPIALNPSRAGAGHILATPKPGWAGTDVLGPIRAALPVPIMLHTDVTAAALAEGRWGAAKGLSDFVYVTIGTGIGMGIVVGGRPITGRMHPEAGHLRVRRMAGDTFPGICPFHEDCLEGLASGPAIAARTGMGADCLPEDRAEWTFIADALAEGVATLLLTLACERIVIGGGVGIGRPHLLPLVRERVAAKLGGYVSTVDDDALHKIIVPAALGGDAGPLGALALSHLILADGLALTPIR